MNDVLVVNGSNSKNSINREVLNNISYDLNVQFAESKLMNVPIYSKDIEELLGIPNVILEMNERMKNFDVIIFSIPEHNGNIPSHFLNILNWMSRLNRKPFLNKEIIILCVTPGKNGGKSMREIFERTMKVYGADIALNEGIANYNSILDFDPELRLKIIELAKS